MSKGARRGVETASASPEGRVHVGSGGGTSSLGSECDSTTRAGRPS